MKAEESILIERLKKGERTAFNELYGIFWAPLVNYAELIVGKEKRKTEPSKEGLLGVEGVPADIIREAFEKAGIIGEKVADRELMTKLDFYELGLSGRPDSSRLRQLVCEKLSLPKKLTANALLEVVNTMLDKESLQALIEKLTSENSKDKENSVG